MQFTELYEKCVSHNAEFFLEHESMPKFGYFITESREPADIDREIAVLKQYGSQKEFGDYTRNDYKNRHELRRVIAFLQKNDTIVVDNIECLGTTLREISSNIQKISEVKAKLVVINWLRFSYSGGFDYICAAHDLILHLGRMRSELSKGNGKRVGRKHNKSGAGRPSKINENLIINAREWITENTKVEEIQDKFRVSRSTAYRIKNNYMKKFPFDRKREREEENF